MNALPVPFYGQGHLPVHSPEGLLVALWENPAENAMEGGSVFPEISQE
jgi:hypothetical protein